jgi:hypothetical protein
MQPSTHIALSNDTESSLTVDGGFIRGWRKSECSRFEVLIGRLTAKDLTSHVFVLVRSKLPDVSAHLNGYIRGVTGTDHPHLSIITDGANGLQSIADRLPFSVTSALDWSHISMRIRHLEQIVKGMRSVTETAKAARNVLFSCVDKIRWCFWYAKLPKAGCRGF